MFASLDNSKKWFKTAKLIIKSPRTFFREMPESSRLKEPAGFAIRTIFLISLLYAPILFFYWSQNFSIGKDAYYFILGMAALFLYSVISTSIYIPVNAIIAHILLLLLGAKGDLKASISVVCYSLSVSLAMFPVITIIALIFQVVVESGIQGMLYQGMSLLILLGIFIPVGYAYYVLFVGFSEVHNISMKRVLVALVGIPAGLLILLVVFAVVFSFFAGFSSSIGASEPSSGNYISNDMYERYEQPDISQPIKQKITAPYGSAPIIDGYYTPEDKWDETHTTAFISGNVSYSIAAKHDGENLYLLVKYEVKPEELDYVSISFEQDGNSHDHNLDTGRTDQKITDPQKYGINHMDDFYFPERIPGQESFFNLEGKENGMLKSNYIDGSWIHEWVIPLRSGDFGDIYINEFPSTLGFNFINGDFYDGGTWPPDMNPYDIETWGDIEILGSDELNFMPDLTTLIASRGAAPVTDGFDKPEDGWDTAQQVYFTSNNINYIIAAKHDGENLYTLVKWESGPEWDGIMGLIYEQDGDSHDHNLMTGRNITMIYLDEDDVENSDITPYGDAKVNYNDGVQVMESYIPLTNPDPDNMKYLFINQTPSTLGFMIFMPWKNNRGSWPVSSAGPYKPETWGDVVILP